MTAPADAFSLLDGELLDRIRRLELFSRFRVEGVLNGLNRSPFKGFSTDFVQHRQYHPGDHLKYLDWRLLAKTEKLYIRQFEEHTNARISVILDVSGSMGTRDQSMTKYEFAQRTAAILFFLALTHRDSFSFSSFRTSLVGHVPFGSGAGHLHRTLAALLENKPADGTDFTTGLDRSTDHIRRRGLTVVLSDFMDDPEIFVKRLSRLRFKGSDVVAMQVYDPSEREFDFTTVTRFHDPEGPEVLVVDPTLIRRQYQEAFDAHIVRIKAACRHHGFEHVALPVGDDYHVPILEFIHWRMERFG
jgi:uncharacterized protein (DUF58 family)